MKVYKIVIDGFTYVAAKNKNAVEVLLNSECAGDILYNLYENNCVGVHEIKSLEEIDPTWNYTDIPWGQIDSELTLEDLLSSTVDTDKLAETILKLPKNSRKLLAKKLADSL